MGSLLIIGSCVYGVVTLKVKDLNGIPLKEVAAGYPCKIELSIDGAQRRMENPTIKGLDQFHLEGRETSMQMINGNASVTYGFRARCNKPGVYTIGPAHLTIEGKEYSSNVVTITVLAEQARSDTKDNDTPFARLRCNKKEAVVGEKVEMSMRFYYPTHDYLLRDVGNPPEKGYLRKNLQGPFAGTERVNGSMYHYVEWSWDIYPTDPGTLAIPAYSFDYDTRKEGREQRFASFSFLFNQQQYDRHRIYSNASELEVVPLPSTKTPVSAVGQFSSFNARITPAHAQEGDGMLLVLELIGHADFDSITLAPLQMPDQLKWYDSQEIPTENMRSGSYKKVWEYVIQGLKAGSYEIPAQKFTYFDTKKRAVVTLATQPLAVSISAGASQEGAAPLMQAQEEQPPVLQSIDVVDSTGIKPIHESGQWYGYYERSMPLWLYIVLMTIPVFFVITRWWYNNQAGRIQRVARKHYLFKQARARLLHAQQRGTGSAVYPEFISILSSCLLIPESMVTSELVEHALQKAGLDDKECQEWKQFFMQAAAYTFYTADHQGTDVEDFFKQAVRWLDICEKRL